MEYNLQSFNSQFIKKTKKSPNSPLIKSPYIKIKIEAKNLDKCLNEVQQNIDSKNLTSINKYSMSLEPWAILTLNNQVKKTKAIYHNSPKWLEEFQFDVKNNKTDKLVIELYSSYLTLVDEKSEKIENLKTGVKFKHPTQESPVFLGFQIIPIKHLEKLGRIGETNSIWMRLINKRQDDYFVKDSKHVLNIENHDPINYKIEESLLLKDKDIGVPLIKITFDYMDFYNLWLLHCSVHTIIQRETPDNKLNYYYRLYIRRNDDLEWFKEKTFEEIEKFRNYLKRYIEEVKNLPFPTKSIFSYLPLIGSYYTEENNDVLIEKKFILDNFFEQICANSQTYKLEEFNNFFADE